MFTILFPSVRKVDQLTWYKPLLKVVLGERLTFKLILFLSFYMTCSCFFVVRMLWVAGFSQVRKVLGKISSSKLGNFILCQGINIDILKENEIKYNITGTSNTIFLTKK